MIEAIEVRYIDLGVGDSLVDLPEGVTRLPIAQEEHGTIDVCPPERAANWIKAHHESGDLPSIESKLGFVGLYVRACDVPVEHVEHGTVLASRDVLFIVE